jgi:hypothetical protein
VLFQIFINLHFEHAPYLCTQVAALEDAQSLTIDRFALAVQDIIILEQMLSDIKVVPLY